ncbi:nitroreductase family protein [Thiomicrorhabdus cannonii]|uniref:nitroreductase family protein n=1 Tax=Thiomicrorhabdus cannonii TaxID=2748011 RepID=UPI0015BBA0C7|nr:nitroreductase [Thiomicrorhabdus cannonii]
MFIASESLLALIQSRRTCYQFDSQVELKADALQLCLEAARWAPNHKLTQPWRYWVLGPNTQSQLAEIYADNRARKKASDECNYDCLYQKAIAKFQRIPQVILVGQVLNPDPVIQKEDYAACACAIQNLQLMAWNLQIGVQWSTGPILQDHRTHALLNSDPSQIELIGALYIGPISAQDQKNLNSNARRKPLEEIVTYLS